MPPPPPPRWHVKNTTTTGVKAKVVNGKQADVVASGFDIVPAVLECANCSLRVTVLLLLLKMYLFK